MNIILGEENINNLGGKYLVLELDTFRLEGNSDPVRSYALIDSLEFSDLFQVEETRKLHQDLIRDYRSKDWKSCEILLDQLRGKWNGELDSFYEIMSERIVNLKTTGVDDDWDGSIIKT